ncbi:MAG: HYR domain-containing [Geobacteraceae bacterium]|nr:MAG: HYR domain-containing [Geobacteraceae bacterium]
MAIPIPLLITVLIRSAGRVRAVVLVGLLFLAIPAVAPGKTIENPYYLDPAWKLWYENPEPVGSIQPPALSNRLYPDDADTTANPGRFLEFRKTDWPERKYAGFWYDVYSSRDSAHSYIRSSWSGDFGNKVTLRPPDSHMHLVGGDLMSSGANWTSQSTTLMGHDLANSQGNIYGLERSYYFANVLRSGPTHISYMDRSLLYSTDLYTALVPCYYNSIGSSGSETMALTKLLIAGGYLPRDLKPALLRNGLFIPTMLYIWKAALPYDVPHDHELKHRVAYTSYGDGSANDYGGSNVNQVSVIANRYDPTAHLRNMVNLAKSMTVAPPIALLRHLETTGGTLGSSNTTAIRVNQGSGETVSVRVSLEDSYDLQKLPLSIRATVLYGNKDTAVVHERGTIYSITVPHDPKLPQGRTVVAFVPNNGITDGNPAMVSIYRSTGPKNYRVEPVGGIRDAAILPGETAAFDLTSRDFNGFPVDFSKWEGIGELDGNIFHWATAPETPEGVYPVRIVASDGSSGNGYNDGQASIRVSKTVADISIVGEGPTIGNAPFTVNFSAENSRDSQGNPLSFTWDFDDANISSQSTPSHTFEKPGIYEVKLTASGPLGSNTAKRLIEVRHFWPLALNNGWTAGGIDTSVWSGTGASVVTDSALGTRLRMKAAVSGQPDTLTTNASFSLPLYVEVDFRRNETAPPNTGIRVLGSLVGNPAGVTNSVYMQHDTSIGHPSAADPTKWQTLFINQQLRLPDLRSLLRMYVDEDPDNAGKIRYRGYLDSDMGERSFAFDNQNPNESWFNSKLALVTTSTSIFDIWRMQVWQPGGAATGPEINVLSDGRTVVERQLTSDASDKEVLVYRNGTYFGVPSSAGGSLSKTFTIRNDGDMPLQLTGASPYVVISGAAASDFSVTSAPNPTIEPGKVTSFDVLFAPGAAGARTAKLSIGSNDPDEATYAFSIQGRGFETPNIDVRGNGLRIKNGADTSNLTDHTDFGPVVGEVVRSFVIHNTGTGVLNISSVAVEGADAGYFHLTKTPRGTVAGGGSTTFSIAFSPLGELRRATVTVSSDDQDTPVYTFSIQGGGLSQTIVPPKVTIGRWSFDEGAGTVAHDETTNGHDVNLFGAGWAQGIMGSALSFDGVDDYATIPSTAALSFGENESFTVEAWIKVAPGITGERVFLGNRSGSTGTGFSLAVLGEGNCRLHVRFADTDGDDTGYLGNNIGACINDGRWHHVGVVVDRSLQQATFYTDGTMGAAIGLQSIGRNGIGDLTSGEPLKIGAGADTYYGGLVDSVAIYKHIVDMEQSVREMRADVAITAEAFPVPLTLGNSLTYRITVSNNGPSPSVGTYVQPYLYTDSEFMGGSPECTEAGGYVECAAGVLASGEYRTFEVLFRPLSLPDSRQYESGIWSWTLTTDPNFDNDYAQMSTDILESDISSLVSITTSSFVYNRATKLYTGNLTVTNSGQTALSGPFALWLNNLTGGVTLVNGNGTFNGYPHIDPTAPTNLNPGESFSVPLQFSNPANAKISFSPVTFRK